jgi:2-oxoglutarate ferredoxin oxidoreductase subunit beta
MAQVDTLQYTPKDFKSDQEVRWCAGCGDIAILNAVQKAMAQLGHKKEDYAVISGIGCSSRFPYYMNTYGFHGIHGRAGALASGVKIANPKLSVWQITGDGDAMAIGGNHFIHEIRRNVDLNILLFNNQIYGLTKGQYSPTSKLGQNTKTSPYGNIDNPFNPGELVIGSQGKFFARAVDVFIDQAVEIFKIADQFKGTSVIEILQNCVIFNNGVYEHLTSKEFREERLINLEHGKPMVFGANKNKGLKINGFNLEVVTIGENGITLDDILVHDAHNPDPTLHLKLINMQYPQYPVALGVIRAVEAPTYNDLMDQQIATVTAKSRYKKLDDLLFSGNTWEVKE